MGDIAIEKLQFMASLRPSQSGRMEELMTLRNSGYKERLLDTHLEKHLKAFGAVEIVGSMWCGKTWMAEAHGESKINLSSFQTRELVGKTDFCRQTPEGIYVIPVTSLTV
ncbi:MAG: hypothetical protein LBK04_01210 [Clostridiales Family XIII bacterium]|nr:hypothetical protein [Clostridiales Family XIII bacterium]